MERFIEIHNQINGFVWGVPLIVALMGTGLFLTFWTGGIQFVRFGTAFREVLGKLFSKGDGTGTVTPFQAVATALASTVGVGNGSPASNLSVTARVSTLLASTSGWSNGLSCMTEPATAVATSQRNNSWATHQSSSRCSCTTGCPASPG